MRIGIVTSEVGPAWGAQRYAEELAISLANDHHVFLITHNVQAGSSAQGRVNLDVRKIGKVGGATPIQSIADAIYSGKQVLRLKRQFRLDLIHEVDLGLSWTSDISTIQQLAVPSVEASMRYSLPFWTDDARHLMKTALLRLPFVGMRLEPIALKRRTMFLVASKFMKDDLAKHYSIESQKVRVVPFGVNTTRFAPNDTKRSTARRQLGLREGESLVSFSGWDLARKGLFALLRAVALVPNTKLLVLGRRMLPSTYLRLVASLGIKDRVASIFTTKPEDYYVASDLFMFPSLYDSFGLVVLEAMACGVPVITSRNAGVSEILTHGRDCVLLDEPADHRELAARMAKLLADPDSRTSLSLEGRRTALNHGWGGVAQETAAVYEDILAAR